MASERAKAWWAQFSEVNRISYWKHRFVIMDSFDAGDASGYRRAQDEGKQELSRLEHLNEWNERKLAELEKQIGEKR